MNVNVVAVTLMPGVATSGPLDVVVLVCKSDMVQSGVAVPSVVKASASIVNFTGPEAGGCGAWIEAAANALTLGFRAGTESV